MRRMRHLMIASFVLASFTSVTTTMASAASTPSPLTIEIAPVYFLSTTGDGAAPPAPGSVPLYSGSTRGTNNLRLDYGLTYQFSKRTSFSYSHSNFDFTLGRITSLSPGTSLLTGDIGDRTDTLSYNYNVGHGLAVNAYYYSHQRDYVQSTCMNQEMCTSPTSGAQIYNTASINEDGYGVGAKYSFGTGTLSTGPLFTVGVDARYVPRPSSNPTAGLNGLPNYVGSQTLFPYSITMRPPIKNNYGLIPFVGYARDYALFRGESTPETYNVVQWGFVKIVRPGLTFSFANIHFNGCYCSDTVPPPDNVRFTDAVFKIAYDFRPLKF